MLTAGSTSYTYDANGNELSAGSRTFAWDLANRLKSTTSGATTLNYSYDGQGKRMTATQGTSGTRFVWDVQAPVPVLAAEKDNATGALQRQYGYGPAGATSLLVGTSAYYFHVDRLGSVINLSSATGVKQWTYDYEPYGSTRSEVKNKNTAPTNLLRFDGQFLDVATSLYHLGARQYDPGNGRFLSVDPKAGSLTDPFVATYAYARNRPTVMVDPSGLASEKPQPPGCQYSSFSPARCPNVPVPGSSSTYNAGKCLAGLLGFSALELSAGVFEGAGLGLQGISFTLFGFTVGASTPVSALGVGAGGVMEVAGTGIAAGGVGLVVKTCVQ